MAKQIITINIHSEEMKPFAVIHAKDFTETKSFIATTRFVGSPIHATSSSTERSVFSPSTTPAEYGNPAKTPIPGTLATEPDSSSFLSIRLFSQEPVANQGKDMIFYYGQAFSSN